MSMGHGKEVDYWALGVLVYEMMSGDNPFYIDGMEQDELYNAIVNELPYEMKDGISASDQVRELTDLLLLKDPQERLGAFGFQEILDHPWFLGMPSRVSILNKELSADKASELLFDDVHSAQDSNDHETFAADMEQVDDLPDLDIQSLVQLELPEDFGETCGVRSGNGDDKSRDETATFHLDDAIMEEQETEKQDDTNQNGSKTRERGSVGRVRSVNDEDDKSLDEALLRMNDDDAKTGGIPKTKERRNGVKRTGRVPSVNDDSKSLYSASSIVYTPADAAEDDRGKQDNTTTQMISTPDTPKPKLRDHWLRKNGLGYYVSMVSPADRENSRSRRGVVDSFLSQHLKDFDGEDLLIKDASDRTDRLNRSCPSFGTTYSSSSR